MGIFAVFSKCFDFDKFEHFYTILESIFPLLNTRATTAKSVNRGKHAGTWYGKSIPPPSDYKKPNKATLRHSL